MRSDAEITQKSSPNCTLFSLFYRRPVIIQGLSWISGISVLSSGLVWAQTDPNPDRLVVPTIEKAPRRTLRIDAAPERSHQPVVEFQRRVIPERQPVSRRRRAVISERQSVIRRERPARKPEREPVAVVRQRPAVRIEREPIVERQRPAVRIEREPIVERQRPAVRIEREPVIAERKVKLSAPKLVIPDTSQEVSTFRNLPQQEVKSALNQETATPRIEKYNSYIDRTDYSIGATRRYEPPASVVFSERSTGCQKVLQSGKGLYGGICGNSVPSREIAQLRVPRYNNTASSRYINTSSLISRRRSQTNDRASVQIGSLRIATNSNRPSNRRRIIQYSQPGSPSNSNYLQPGSPSDPNSFAAYYTAKILEAIRPSVPNAPNFGNGNSSYIFPLSIPAPITSLFGWRVHPITGDRRFHAGVDLGAPSGTPVLAAYSGQVAIADWMGGYGLAVVLQHSKTQETLYAHLSEITVQPGQLVEQGTVIGRVGSTGNSTGPHLHFESRQLTPNGWVATDPGAQLQYALGQLIESLKTAQATPQQGS